MALFLSRSQVISLSRQGVHKLQNTQNPIEGGVMKLLQVGYCTSGASEAKPVFPVPSNIQDMDFSIKFKENFKDFSRRKPFFCYQGLCKGCANHVNYH